MSAKAVSQKPPVATKNGFMLSNQQQQKSSPSRGSSGPTSPKAEFESPIAQLPLPESSPSSSSAIPTKYSLPSKEDSKSPPQANAAANHEHHHDTGETARLASLVMNLKLTNDETSNDPEHNTSHNLHNQNHERGRRTANNSNATQKLKASQSTKHRAKRTKASLELKYQMIRNFQFHDMPGTEDDQPQQNTSHLPVFGYNPLQILRNRYYRRFVPRRKNEEDNNFWELDPMELVNDYSWSIRNLDLIKKRDGTLVFPEHQHHTNNHSHHPHINRISNKLGGANGGGDEFVQKLKSKLIQRASSTSHISESEDNSSFDELSPPPSINNNNNTSNTPDNRRSLSPVRNIPVDSIKQHTRQSSENTNNNNTHQLFASAPDLSSSQRSKSEPNKELGKPLELKDSNKASAPATKEPPPPQVVPLEKRTTREKSDVEITTAQLAHEIKYLNSVFFLAYMQTYRKNTSCNIPNLHPMELLSNEISNSSQYITEGLIPQYEIKVQDLNKQMDGIHEDFAEKRAPKMDNILVESDKILGEVSTTLNLEIRKIGERLDKVESFAPSPAKLLYSVGYGALEWTVVLFMWLIWGFVSVLGVVKSVFRFLISILKWLMWC